jgi:hypothetical protein
LISSGGTSFGSKGFIIDSGSSGDNWQSSGSKLAVNRPRRFANPSRFQLSPFVVAKSKIQVSRVEADVYEAVIEMAQIKHNWK